MSLIHGGSESGSGVPSPRSLHSPVFPASGMIKYAPWKLHTQLTLESDTNPAHPIETNATETKERIWPRSHPQRTGHAPHTTLSPSGKFQLNMYVERLLSRKVAVLADCRGSADPTTRWVAKFYASDQSSLWHLKKELNAYAACRAVQGAEVPVFYGQWEIRDTPADACFALLMEFVSPGTTIGELRDGLKVLPEGEEKRLARLRLAELHSSGTRAVDRVNECEVMHLDLFGENMVIAAGGRTTGESVVLVDFSNAMVSGVDAGWGTYEHWTLFHMAFMPEYGPGRAWY